MRADGTQINWQYVAAGKARDDAETLMMKRKIFVIATTLGFLASWVNSYAAEKFQKLSGLQVRAKFTGMEMTDNVHFADVFGSNGNLKTYSMGHTKDGKWRVDKDELCVDRGKDDGGCYQVWISGNNVEFRRPGLQATSEGILQRPVARN